MTSSKPIILNSIRLLAFCIFSTILFSCSSSKKISSSTNTPKYHNLSKAQKQKYANILKVKRSDITNDKLYSFLEAWQDVTYKYGGNSMQEGIDCSGFVHQLYQDVYGLKITRNSAQQYDEIKHINTKKLKEGNLVFFQTLGGKKISHVGVYLVNDYFVHVNNKGLIFSRLDEVYWKNHFKGAGKITHNAKK